MDQGSQVMSFTTESQELSSSGVSHWTVVGAASFSTEAVTPTMVATLFAASSDIRLGNVEKVQLRAF
jgi:hypothetical protein